MAYIMADVESDGPIPGDYSMVSFGAVMVENNLDKIFYGKLKQISDNFSSEALAVSGLSREETMLFDDPKIVMENFAGWLKTVCRDKPIFISDNNGFDWMFICWYFHSKKEMNEIAETFKNAMDTIAGSESSLEEVHLFGSLPTGLAFLIGTKISPNIHPLAQTYQYKASMDPKYNKAILVNGAIADNVPLTEEEKRTALELRQLAENELRGDIHTFLEKNMSSSNGRSWYLGAVPQLPSAIMAEPFWSNIPPISDTNLLSDSFDFDMTSIDGGFFWKTNKWFVDDVFFIALKKRLGSEEKIKKAIRLFLFHEALNYKRHKLGAHNARDIGSFPKVLETADYQADVYGLINEYSFSLNSGHAISNPRDFFLGSIDVATETMWSFDDREGI
jgi:hypothetical protein